MPNPPAFNAPQPVAYDATGQPVYRQPILPVQVAPVPAGVACDQCGQEFQYGEPTVELFLGVIGQSEKSGRAIVVDDPDIEHPELTRTWTVHPQCAVECVNHYICDWGDDANICAMCEQRIEDE